MPATKDQLFPLPVAIMGFMEKRALAISGAAKPGVSNVSPLFAQPPERLAEPGGPLTKLKSGVLPFAAGSAKVATVSAPEKWAQAPNRIVAVIADRNDGCAMTLPLQGKAFVCDAPIECAKLRRSDSNPKIALRSQRFEAAVDFEPAAIK